MLWLSWDDFSEIWKGFLISQEIFLYQTSSKIYPYVLWCYPQQGGAHEGEQEDGSRAGRGPVTWRWVQISYVKKEPYIKKKRIKKKAFYFILGLFATFMECTNHPISALSKKYFPHFFSFHKKNPIHYTAY